MKKGTLRVTRRALAVGLSFVLVGTMSENLTVVNAKDENVTIHREERALPTEFELDYTLQVSDIDEKKGNKNKTKVLLSKKNINNRHL